jgi:hypothetical protein
LWHLATVGIAVAENDGGALLQEEAHGSLHPAGA